MCFTLTVCWNRLGDFMAAGNDFRHAHVVLIDPRGSWKVMSVMQFRDTVEGAQEWLWKRLAVCANSKATASIRCR